MFVADEIVSFCNYYHSNIIYLTCSHIILTAELLSFLLLMALLLSQAWGIMLGVPSTGDTFSLHAHPLPSQTQVPAPKLVVFGAGIPQQRAIYRPFHIFSSAPPSSTGHTWGINPFLPPIQSATRQRMLKDREWTLRHLCSLPSCSKARV